MWLMSIPRRPRKQKMVPVQTKSAGENRKERTPKVRFDERERARARRHSYNAERRSLCCAQQQEITLTSEDTSKVALLLRALKPNVDTESRNHDCNNSVLKF
mmetsp:Transcript_15717/g.43498  ORF Transcript_15717/g.43498 Transcript_15717/m.43498 type:complete len:102 (+) Transcript_15717:1232-1537(+)